MTENQVQAISVSGLRKSFGTKVVLDGIDLEVPAGQIWALLGPNGAGKTTIVNILTTLYRPDAGQVRVDGHDLAKDPDGIRRVIGVTGQFAAVDEMLTGAENLQLMGDLYHVDRKIAERRATDLLAQFDLTDSAKKIAAEYSGGMRRKLDLAMTLMGNPRVVFLDEPTTGLDPRSRHAMWAIIRRLVAEGGTIFLTTQYLEEADELADFVLVLDHGRLVAQGTPAELKRLVPGAYVLLTFDAIAALDLAAGVIGETCPDVTRDDHALTLRVPGDGDPQFMRDLFEQLDRVSIQPIGMSVHTPDLDDVFLSLTGRPVQEAADNNEEKELSR